MPIISSFAILTAEEIAAAEAAQLAAQIAAEEAATQAAIQAAQQEAARVAAEQAAQQAAQQGITQASQFAPPDIGTSNVSNIVQNAGPVSEGTQVADMSQTFDPFQRSEILQSLGKPPIAPEAASTFNYAANSTALPNVASPAASYSPYSLSGSGATESLKMAGSEGIKGTAGSYLNSTPSALSKGWDTATTWMGQHPYYTAAGAYLGANKLGLLDNKKQNFNDDKYNGPLSRYQMSSDFKGRQADPTKYQYTPRYADGGGIMGAAPVEQMSNNAMMGVNTMYPMANISTSSYGTPDQMASGGQVPRMANGGISGSGNLNLNVPLDFGGANGGGGFGGAGANGYSAVGSGGGSQTGFTGQNNTAIGAKGGAGLSPLFNTGQTPFDNTFEGDTFQPQGTRAFGGNPQQMIGLLSSLMQGQQSGNASAQQPMQMAEGGQVPSYASGGFFKNVLGDVAQFAGDAGAGVGQFVNNLGQGRVSIGRPESDQTAEQVAKKYYTNTAPAQNVNPQQYQYNQQYAEGGVARFSGKRGNLTNSLDYYTDLLGGESERQIAEASKPIGGQGDAGKVRDTDPDTAYLTAPEAAAVRMGKVNAKAYMQGLTLPRPKPINRLNLKPQGVKQAEAAASLDPEMAAHGGIMHSSLGGYAAGGNSRLLKGPGDGMSDNIPATIAGRQPARLADGEFVIPADVVSHLGNGSTEAGAKKLHEMMNKIRKARTGNSKQGKQINPNKFLPT